MQRHRGRFPSCPARKIPRQPSATPYWDRLLAGLRGLADFAWVCSLFINERDEKIFTTSAGAGDGGRGDWGRRLEPELLDQALEGWVERVNRNARPSVVGR